MNCEKYLILIDDLIEGELDSEIAAQVNSHLLNCPECASYQQMLGEEKAIYAQFLFDAEPPKDLWNQFQAKIETDPVLPSHEKAAVSGSWNFNIFSYFRFYPALGVAAFLVFCAYGFWQFAPYKFVSDDEYAAQISSVFNESQNQLFSEVVSDKPELLSAENETKAIVSPLKPTQISDKSKNSNRKTVDKITTRFAAKSVQPKIRKLSDEANQELKAENQLTEEQLQLRALETETAQQIEKIELLLRAFRNARVVEGSAVYDIAYEKQQARKLLGKNVQLRQIAGSYGALYTEELLDKAEPFLLDIANLDNNPQPEKVLDIKERVKNQNIIASLQVY